MIRRLFILCFLLFWPVVSRPADVYIENRVDRRKIAFDVSVTSPTQEAVIHQAAVRPAAAIEARKSSQIRTHFANRVSLVKKSVSVNKSVFGRYLFLPT